MHTTMKLHVCSIEYLASSPGYPIFFMHVRGAWGQGYRIPIIVVDSESVAVLEGIGELGMTI